VVLPLTGPEVLPTRADRWPRVTRVTDPSQPRLVGEGTPVTVSWGDPAQFTEVRYSTNPTLASEGDWVVELADYVSTKTARAVTASIVRIRSLGG